MFRQDSTCPALLDALPRNTLSPTGLSPSTVALSRAVRLKCPQLMTLACSAFARRYLRNLV
jgi:hypothetical protein